MNETFQILIDRLQADALKETNVIPWGAPVPAFGDLWRSKIATLGLNPSNREFVDDCGNELDGTNRRFHTLRSLNLRWWSETESEHFDLMVESCTSYFSKNPYDRWFKKLDYIIEGTGASYYSALFKSPACHLDLIPYATACKWTELNKLQRTTLLEFNADTLGELLRDSNVSAIILNGKSVIETFCHVTNAKLETEVMHEWMLPRRTSAGVLGHAYEGSVSSIAGIDLEREIEVFGFNHNLQSSFGVTKRVMDSIRKWLTLKLENYAS